MLSIGEFSNICKVSTKTLRYYAEIGLILPDQINPENGYRYYSIQQLETMLLINRLKSYQFSLDEIKNILDCDKAQDEYLFEMLMKKQQHMQTQIHAYENSLSQLNEDLSQLKQGKSIMSYLDNIDVQLVEVPTMHVLSIRKMVLQQDMINEYNLCFGSLFKKVAQENLTVLTGPMVLFHSDEFSPLGLDTEFAVVIKESNNYTHDFHPGLCLKTVHRGSYTNLPAVYAKQIEWAETNGYINNNALYEIYINDPSEVTSEIDLISEIYYPVQKR